MAAVVATHDLEVVQVLCRVVDPNKLSELRGAEALRVRSIDGAEVLPDGTILVESQIAAASLSANGDVALVGCLGEIHCFFVGLNRA